MPQAKFPGPTDRVYILGRSGCGKTTAAIWHFSATDYSNENAPAGVLVNTKGDSTLNELAALPIVKTVAVTDNIGKSGLFHVRPDVQSENGQQELDNFLRRLWDRGNCRILIDEGYMLQIDDALNALLTQGRDRRISMIVLTQRPTWISKFVESEANFVQLFNLSRRDDRKNVTGLVPVDRDYKLAKYCSYWYNVDDDTLVQFSPVPDKQAILKTFRDMHPPEHEAPILGIAPIEARPVTKKVI